MLSNFGLTEILILAGVVMLVFGAKRFPVIGRSLGQGIRNLIGGVKGAFDDDAPKLPPADHDDSQQSR